MQLEVSKYELPKAISFNYEEIKQELTEKVEMYKTLVYTDDQVSSAKKDRANLNAFKKSLNDERIRLEKEYLEPFNDFKSKINELIKIVDEPVAIIDKQIKDYEQKVKDEKRTKIEELWDSLDMPEFMRSKLSKIWDEKWLNTSVSMKTITDALNNEITRVESELTIIQSLAHPEEARIVYEDCLSLALATSESDRIAKIQAAVQAKKEAELKAQNEVKEEPAPVAEPTQATISADVEEKKMVVRFECEMTVDEAKALRAWFIDNSIKFKAI